MNIGGSIALDIMSFVYAFVLFVGILSSQSRASTVKKKYLYLIVALGCMLLTDVVYLSLYGRVYVGSWIIIKLIKSLYFSFNSLIALLWAKYVTHLIHGEREVFGKNILPQRLLFYVNIVIIVIDLFTDVCFGITPEMKFEVKPIVMWIFTAINYLSFIISYVSIVKHRGEINKVTCIALLIFPLPPVIGEIIQIFFRQYSLIGSYSVSIMIIYLTSQNASNYTDELTGLSTRRLFNDCLTVWLGGKHKKKICGLMLDIDDLKKINDLYGHLAGDNALIATADIIRSVKRKGMVCSRFGGDEFIIIWLSKDALEIGNVLRALESGRDNYNARHNEGKLNFSIGTFYCSGNGKLTVDEFVETIDENMYETKKAKKAGKTKFEVNI